MAPSCIEGAVDRFLAAPGQGIAWFVGSVKIQELRARANAPLGDTFDIRAFHDEVLREGAMPLDVLEQRIDAWIAARAETGRAASGAP